MSSIRLHNLGKKFGKEWIFRNLHHDFSAQSKTVILGGNGSGKSTLLQLISGFVVPNEGHITYSKQNQTLEAEAVKNQVSFASPYLQLIEDYSLEEMVQHAIRFKPLMANMGTKEFIERIELGSARHKLLKQFSSGMKQRVKLGLAILSEAPILLLDEPVSNLDKAAIQWYRNLVETFGKDKTVMVCSNAIEDEYFFCTQSLRVEDFKP